MLLELRGDRDFVRSVVLKVKRDLADGEGKSGTSNSVVLAATCGVVGAEFDLNMLGSVLVPPESSRS